MINDFRLINNNLFQIWSSTITFSLLVIIVILSVGLNHLKVKLFLSDSPIYFAYDCHKTALIICSFIITLVPVMKNSCKPKHTASITSAATNATRRAEIQLLYETIFVCFWKILNAAAIIVGTMTQPSLTYFTMDLVNFVGNGALLMSNVGGLIALLIISRVFREACRKAFWLEKAKVIISSTSK